MISGQAGNDINNYLLLASRATMLRLGHGKIDFAATLALLFVLINDQGLGLEGLLVNPLDHQGNLVVLVQGGPVFLERVFSVVEDRHQFREAVERRNRATVGFVCADEVAETRQSLLVFKRHAFATGFFAVVAALENGELVHGRLGVLVMDAGNTRREVRSIVFVLARSESAFEGAAELDGVVYRIGLVAVGDNLDVGGVACRVVNNQVRVRELGLVEGLCLHKAGLGFHFENAVAAVDAAAHDPVDLHVGLAVGAFAEHDATTGVRVVGEGLEILFCFICVCHKSLPFRVIIVHEHHGDGNAEHHHATNDDLLAVVIFALDVTRILFVEFLKGGSLGELR